MRATATLALVRAIGALEFRPLDANDSAAFAGAPADSEIAFTSDDALVQLCNDAGLNVPRTHEAGSGLAVITGEGQIEAHGICEDGSPWCVALQLDRLI